MHFHDKPKNIRKNIKIDLEAIAEHETLIVFSLSSILQRGGNRFSKKLCLGSGNEYLLSAWEMIIKTWGREIKH